MILLNWSYLFSLRDCAKVWFSSLPKNSIDSWNRCKDAFISKYFPPAKIISLRNDIMNFKQLDHEHVAQSWGRMKLMIRNCLHMVWICGWLYKKIMPDWILLLEIYLIRPLKLLLWKSTLGEATKLLDNIMVNYSQWHAERSSTSKKSAYDWRG